MEEESADNAVDADASKICILSRLATLLFSCLSDD